MLLAEIRDLDGPNLFLLQPAIKVEFASLSEADLELSADRFGASVGPSPLQRFESGAAALVADLHDSAGLPAPDVLTRTLDTPGSVAISFEWRRRSVGLAAGEAVAAVALGDATVDQALEQVRRASSEKVASDDQPLMVRDDERTIPVVAVTGTNGKTTTTRLLAHIAMTAGRHTGWSSSSGVYIDGQEVLSGDYSGPSGARRVLAAPEIGLAVLETARGGILLRGVACESNDVSVFTNVSADHLDLHGIRTIESLAEVKAVVCRITKPKGVVVVNASDPLVLAATAGVRAPRLLFSVSPDQPAFAAHAAAGGAGVTIRGGEIGLVRNGEWTSITAIADVPITFGGRAKHMIENALAACGAALGIGLSVEQIGAGLRSFRNSPELNLGRLNVFDLDGVIVIMDFAHNEAGLELLLDFGHRWTGEGGRVTSIIGTAGDRTSFSLRELGRIAAQHSDRVIMKKTKKYGRGRTNEELLALYREGAASVGTCEPEVAAGELEAFELAFSGAKRGDVIAIMCQEHMEELRDRLASAGRAVS